DFGKFDAVAIGLPVMDGRQSRHFASIRLRRVPDGRPARFGVFDECREFADDNTSRQRCGRIALRGRDNRMECTETERNQDPGECAVDHPGLGSVMELPAIIPAAAARAATMAYPG